MLERTGDDAYKVAIKVKVGPMSMTYRGEVEITERDEAAHRAVMKARAKESRGQGTADADVTMVLTGDERRHRGDGRRPTSQLSGKVATMGQGVLQDVSGRLVQTFAQNLAAMLEGGEAGGRRRGRPGAPRRRPRHARRRRGAERRAAGRAAPPPRAAAPAPSRRARPRLARRRGGRRPPARPARARRPAGRRLLLGYLLGRR